MSESFSRTQAVRLFAAELAAATQTITFSDAEKAPQYQLLPSGGRANRVFVVGTLTELEDVGQASEYWKARVVDPNGDAFFVYAGQYQPEAQATFREMEPPTYLAVVGKLSTYQGDEGETYVNITPEQVTEVDEATRDRWVVETARQTLARVEAGLAGQDAPGEAPLDADLFEMAVDAYGQDGVELAHERATEAVATLQAEDAHDGDSSEDADSGEACPHCGDVFDSQQGVNIHVGMVHPEQKADDPAEDSPVGASAD